MKAVFIRCFGCFALPAWWGSHAGVAGALMVRDTHKSDSGNPRTRLDRLVVGSL